MKQIGSLTNSVIAQAPTDEPTKIGTELSTTGSGRALPALTSIVDEMEAAQETDPDKALVSTIRRLKICDVKLQVKPIFTDHGYDERTEIAVGDLNEDQQTQINLVVDELLRPGLAEEHMDILKNHCGNLKTSAGSRESHYKSLLIDFAPYPTWAVKNAITIHKERSPWLPAFSEIKSILDYQIRPVIKLRSASRVQA